MTIPDRPHLAPWFYGRWSAAALVCLLLLPGASAAQNTGSWLCLEGRPAPGCRGFFRIEARGGTSLLESGRYQYRGTMGPAGVFTPVDSIPWTHVGDWGGVEVGYAVNVNDRWALGGGLALDKGNETERILVRARVRRWLRPRLYADALSGVFRQERDLLYRSGDHAVENSGLSTELRVGMAGYGFVLARYDLVRADEVMVVLPGSQQVAYAPGGGAHALSVGGGLEGRTALVAAAATALGMVLVGIVVGWPGA